MLGFEYGKFYGSKESFVFILEPKVIKYDCIGENGNILFCLKNSFSIGDGE